MAKSNNELHKAANAKLFALAKELRQTSTEAEIILWKELRNRKLAGLKFRRQHPISNFIADFYCTEKRLVVELDGNIHENEAVKEYDEARTIQLNELGIEVVRFQNYEVKADLQGVLKRMVQIALKR